VARAYKVLKTDQHIYLNGKELLKDDATLQELHIGRNSILLLKVCDNCCVLLDMCIVDET
jgi:hypothetical protein